VELVKQLHASMSYRQISAALAAKGHVTANGKPYMPTAIQKMLRR
jgi:hypothetical protein